MTLSEVQKGFVTIIKAQGQIDAALSQTIEKKVCEHLSNGKVKILLDLTDVTYINSAGLRMLLAIKKQVKTLAGTFVVCGLRSEVMEIMKICGFDYVLEIAANEEEALQRFK